jgi:DNA helicase-2/ATP-dependent DNA helicase PcrA
MSDPSTTNDDTFDVAADDEIAACLNEGSPTSFFLFAGAGSGKTRSLVVALKRVRDDRGARFRLNGQRIGVITYTNKASDEIERRLDVDPLFAVSTIHSFAWSLIGGFDDDIRQWLRCNIQEEIEELRAKEAKGRAGQASTDRKASILSKTNRLARLSEIRRFTYSPNSDNRGRDALGHSEVIRIAANFLETKPTLRGILVNRFPILLIDESQDTNKLLIEALLAVQAERKSVFALGLIGDMMQRIYNDGKADLDRNLPVDWAKPAKVMNHRCPARIVTLINHIRGPVDGQSQRPRSDKVEGTVRLFLLPSSLSDDAKTAAERAVKEKMAELTGDKKWTGGGDAAKTLMLEHRMAARRLGFLPIFEALYGSDNLKSGLVRGDLPGLRLFTHIILPLLESHRKGDSFAVAAILRKYSPLLDSRAFETGDQIQQISKTRDALESLASLWDLDPSPSLLKVLMSVSQTGLLKVPESLRAFAIASGPVGEAVVESNDGGDPVPDESDSLTAWRAALESPFEQIKHYDDYINGRSAFDTHQGVKGLEFPRVCVVMGDDEAKGWLFSYEKLFGAKDGAQVGDATRRLFYVTCSRAESSLALVNYTSAPTVVRDHVLREGWFSEDEIDLTIH